MNLTVALAAAAIGLVTPLSVLAQSSTQAVGAANKDVLAATSANIQGDAITYPTGTPEISSWTITFEKGGHSSLHQHPIPLYVYVLEGELEVRPEGGEPYREAQGEAYIEPQNVMMQAFNVADGPTKILIVALGAQGQKTTVAAE